MGYVRITDRPEELFHYTRRDNLASILRDGRIKRMGDAECWFCSTLDDTLELMRATVMVEGKPYVKLGGSIGRYPKCDSSFEAAISERRVGPLDAGNAPWHPAGIVKGRREFQ